MTIFGQSKNVTCTIGANFKLTFWQRIRLLFCKELHLVVFEYGKVPKAMRNV